MRRRSVVIAGALACGPTIAVDAADESTAAKETTTSGGTTSSTTTEGATTEFESTSTSTTEPGDTRDWPTNFIDDPDDGSTTRECDAWHQDCPLGEKCMPWSNNGESTWNATRCSPIAEDPGQPGDACTVGGSAVSGIDSCDIATMCWDVDPETNEGTCVAFCSGNENNPICADPQTSCPITSEGVLILCLPSCDPLVQDCGDDRLCAGYGDHFICVPDQSGEGGAFGDTCEYVTSCDPGLECAASTAVAGCEGPGCCTPYCDVTTSEPCPGAGQTCVPYFSVAPPGYQNVGVCAVPA